MQALSLSFFDSRRQGSGCTYYPIATSTDRGEMHCNTSAVGVSNPAQRGQTPTSGRGHHALLPGDAAGWPLRVGGVFQEQLAGGLWRGRLRRQQRAPAQQVNTRSLSENQVKKVGKPLLSVREDGVV